MGVRSDGQALRDTDETKCKLGTTQKGTEGRSGALYIAPHFSGGKNAAPSLPGLAELAATTPVQTGCLQCLCKQSGGGGDKGEGGINK